MPIKDDLLIFDTEKSIVVNAGQTVVLTDVVPIPVITDVFGNSDNDSPGIMPGMCWNVVAEGADLTAAGDSATVTFDLYEDTDSTPTTGGTVILSKAITVGTTTAHPDGYVICSIPLPIGEIKPYLGVLVSVASQNMATGKITSWIGPPLTNK